MLHGFATCILPPIPLFFKHFGRLKNQDQQVQAIRPQVLAPGDWFAHQRCVETKRSLGRLHLRVVPWCMTGSPAWAYWWGFNVTKKKWNWTWSDFMGFLRFIGINHPVREGALLAMGSPAELRIKCHHMIASFCLLIYCFIYIFMFFFSLPYLGWWVCLMWLLIFHWRIHYLHPLGGSIGYVVPYWANNTQWVHIYIYWTCNTTCEKSCCYFCAVKPLNDILRKHKAAS